MPLILFPFRKAFNELTGWDKRDFSWARHIGITAVMLTAKLLLAIVLPGIKVVFSVVGATSSVMLIFVLPASIYLRCVDADDRRGCIA